MSFVSGVPILSPIQFGTSFPSYLNSVVPNCPSKMAHLKASVPSVTRVDSSANVATLKKQADRQKSSNFNSSSLVSQGITQKMSSQTVNKTNLHPGGVQ